MDRVKRRDGGVSSCVMRGGVVVPAVLAALTYLLFAAPGLPEPPSGARAAAVFDTERARVLFVADGDTLRARLSDGSVRLIRFTGVNAPEVHRYKTRTAEVRGDCHSVQAMRLVRGLLHVGQMVELRAQNVGSQTGDRQRLRRLVWRPRRPHDVAAEELRGGLALWLPNHVEHHYDRLFRSLAQRALRLQIGMYAPLSCRATPQPADQPYLHVRVHGDAYRADRQHLNDEYVAITLGGRAGAAAPRRLVCARQRAPPPGRLAPGPAVPAQRDAVARAHGDGPRRLWPQPPRRRVHRPKPLLVQSRADLREQRRRRLPVRPRRQPARGRHLLKARGGRRRPPPRRPSPARVAPLEPADVDQD